MTSSLKYSVRNTSTGIAGLGESGGYARDIGPVLGSRELSETQALRLRAASIRAQGINQNMQEATANPNDYDFETDRAAWLLAKEVVFLSAFVGGDMARHMAESEAAAAAKARAEQFIPLALEVYWSNPNRIA